MNKLLAATVGCLVPGLCASFAVSAASNLDLTLGAGTEFHDNALRVDTDKQSDYAWVGRGIVGYHNDDPLTRVDLNYLLEDRNFVHDIEADETSVNGRSSLLWQALPRNLEVELSHDASSQVIDRRGANVPSNREQRSVTSAGVNAYAHVSAVDTLALRPGFTDVNVSGETGVDSQRSVLGADWDHQINAVSDLSLSLSRAQVNSDLKENDYDNDTVMLTYAARLSRLRYSLGAGSNRIVRDSNDKRINGQVVELKADYGGNNVDWGASYIQQLTDSGVGLTGLQRTPQEFTGGDGNVAEFDILESREAELHATVRMSDASTLLASVSYLRYDYETTPRDEEDWAATLRYTYNVSSNLQLGVGALARRAEFTDDPQDLVQKDDTVELTADYRFSQRLSLHAALGREERESDAAFGDYVDLYAMMHLDYQIY